MRCHAMCIVPGGCLLNVKLQENLIYCPERKRRREHCFAMAYKATHCTCAPNMAEIYLPSPLSTRGRTQSEQSVSQLGVVAVWENRCDGRGTFEEGDAVSASNKLILFARVIYLNVYFRDIALQQTCTRATASRAWSRVLMLRHQHITCRCEKQQRLR